MPRTRLGLIARLYDPILGPLVAGFRHAGLDLAPSRTGLRVLDVGCGTGAHLALYEADGASVRGVDTSEAMVERARRRLGVEGSAFIADAVALPFRDGSFDLVIAMTLLHQFERSRQAEAVAEMRRVVAPEGRVLVIDHHPGRPKGMRGRISSVAAASIEALAGSDHRRSHRMFLRSGGLPTLLSGSGLVIDRWTIAAAGRMGIYLLRPICWGADQPARLSRTSIT